MVCVGDPVRVRRQLALLDLVLADLMLDVEAGELLLRDSTVGECPFEEFASICLREPGPLLKCLG